MFAFLARRLLSTIPVLLIVAVLVFLMLRLTPGDPAAVLAGDAATTEQIAKIRTNLGLDRSIPEQFAIWFGHMLTGDLGESFYYKTKVTTLIGQRLEPTLSLALLTITIAVLVAVPLGVLAAWRFGGWLDRALMGFSVLGFSIPVFVLAYLLIGLFSIRLEWLPVQGYRSLAEGFWPWLSHLILPSIALGTVYMAFIARITRAAMLEVLAQDFIRTANAKGLAPRAVLTRHALKNAGVPIMTVIGIGIALLISGAIVTETVFAIPGIGSPTMVVGLISGGINTNVVPDRVVFRLDRRIIPEENPETVERQARLTGEHLVNAYAGPDPQNPSRYALFFAFDNPGTRTFCRITREFAGQRFAILLDNQVLTAPVINEPICGGSGQITGSFDLKSAAELARMLKAGALPAELNVIEERTVDASLGQEAIESGTNASIVAGIVTLVFMLLAYGLFGLFACLALVINGVLIVATMSLIGAALTLPGIAGLILTIAMAVDANVLIYERMREELARGASAWAPISNRANSW